MTARDTSTGNLFIIRHDQQQVLSDITYVDGLGRSLQGVMREASTDEKDIIKMYTYDVFRIQDKDYLPYKAGTTDGSLSKLGYPKARVASMPVHQV